ncbi:desumoylating isopeptidase 1 [Pelomyxa schiedti]|nr:desumoylating isopeptidase 1 [Pelomyxa schiedti]
MGDDEESAPVSLNCYDISGGWAARLSDSIVGKHIEGIWHTGLVVHGYEYFWGGEIGVMRPGRTPFGAPTKSYKLGSTFVPKELVDDYVNGLRPQYTPQTYSLLSNNCNNFTNELNLFLTGNSNPPEIMTQADEIMNTDAGRAFKPFILKMEADMKKQLAASNTGFMPPSPLFVPPAPAAAASMSTASAQQHSDKNPLLSVKGAVEPATIMIKALKNSQLSAEDKDAFVHLNNFFPPTSSPIRMTQPPHQSVYALFDKMISWPAEDLFYVLFIFRMLIVVPPVAHYYTSHEGDPLKALIEKTVSHMDRKIKIMGLELTSNIFATREGEFYMLVPERLDRVLNLILPLLGSTDTGVKQAASSLVYNYSISLDGKDAKATAAARRCATAVAESLATAALDASSERLVMSLCQITKSHPPIAGSLAENAELQAHLFDCPPDSPVQSQVTQLLTTLNAS